MPKSDIQDICSLFREWFIPLDLCDWQRQVMPNVMHAGRILFAKIPTMRVTMTLIMVIMMKMLMMVFRKHHMLPCLHEEAEDGPEAQLHQYPQMSRSL